MRICKQCGVPKPVTEFYKAVHNKDGLNKRCKQCVLANGKVRDDLLRDTPEWKRRSRERQIKHRYGITLEEYEQMFAAQDGRCLICLRTSDENLCVDHDHRCCPGLRSCGDCIRGLLCRQCNSLLGFAGDSGELLRNALIYLEEH